MAIFHRDRISFMHCRDIKPSNVFLSVGKAVIGDFGLGRHLAPCSLAKTQVGTPLYFSPEVCMECPYGLPSDVWAFGCAFAPVVLLSLWRAPSMQLAGRVCAADDSLDPW
jgi:serine/threonine protein kinase